MRLSMVGFILLSRSENVKSTKYYIEVNFLAIKREKN